MPNPKEIFDNPLQYLNFLKSANFESQCFERKEVCTETKKQIKTLKEGIAECISGFANSNRKGGLLVLGIANNGTLKGTQHVDEQTINSILKVIEDLKGHSTEPLVLDDPALEGKHLNLFYTHWTPNAICETGGALPKGWKRVGAQNLLLTQLDRDQLRRDKRIVDFEMAYCCPYDSDELDDRVVEEFKKAFLEGRNAQYTDYTTEGVLHQAGAPEPFNCR